MGVEFYGADSVGVGDDLPTLLLKILILTLWQYKIEAQENENGNRTDSPSAVGANTKQTRVSIVVLNEQNTNDKLKATPKILTSTCSHSKTEQWK